MPGLAQRNEHHCNGSFGFWSKNSNDVSYNQLQKFWSELSPQARLELLKVDKQTLFEQARKNMYCSRCNGLLLEGFVQIVMYGKSLQQEGAIAGLVCLGTEALRTQNQGRSVVANGNSGEMQDPSVHPWGGLIPIRDSTLTLMDCYLYSKSLKGLQHVFDSARAREREREMLYPDACGGGGRGWISQGMTSYGRGHGTRETCALHTARLSCDTLVDFWSALGEETRQSLLKMKEEDFIERLMYRFDSKRFCRDCRRNVIREFKELKELKRLRREPRCTSWFCVADIAFQYEVSIDSIQANWRQTFPDAVGTYHHFEWGAGTGEGKSDIVEFENVGLKLSVQVCGLDLRGLSACFITLRAFKLDGRCSELSVKAHALKGQQCVHCRLVVGDGFVSIVRGESIRSFFEHAEEAEEEEDDDSMDKDGNELDGECSRPQKHAKSPELAREFLLDAATVIFKEQVEKAFREGTARQNAHSIFVCLALKLLEERVHVACKEIITLEKQTKLLEEEEKEKREEEERRERRRAKEKEKKLRRKERLKGKEKEKQGPESLGNSILPVVPKEKFPQNIDEEQINDVGDSDSESGAVVLSRPGSPDTKEEFSNGHLAPRTNTFSYDSPDSEVTNIKDGSDSFTQEYSRITPRRVKYRKEAQSDPSLKWYDRRRSTNVLESDFFDDESESRYYNENSEIPSRVFNGSNRQMRANAPKANGRNGVKFHEKPKCTSNRMGDRYESHSCSCSQHNEYRAKVDLNVSATRVTPDLKSGSKSEPAMDVSKKLYRGSRYNQTSYPRDASGRPKSKTILGHTPTSRDSVHSKQVWEPLESQRKYSCSNSESDKVESFIGNSSGEIDEDNNVKEEICKNELPTQTTREVAVADEEVELCPPKSSLLNETSDPLMCITSNSDNCSSCLSKGASSNNENSESSTTSDSEDPVHQSEERESVKATQNGYTAHLEKTKGIQVEGCKNYSVAPPVSVNQFTIPIHNQDNGISSINSNGSNPQGIYQPIPNQNIQFPMYQAPATMGYYHQNHVSWPAGPATGLISYPHPNQYLYAPLGYGVQYGSLPQLSTPVYNGAIPVYHQVAKSNGVNAEQLVVSAHEYTTEAYKETVLHAKPHPPSSESRKIDDPGELDVGDEDAFSLFHFGGPVALSGGKSNPVNSRNGFLGDFSSQFSTDHVENDHACNKKEIKIEEYNLFAKSNGTMFSFF